MHMKASVSSRRKQVTLPKGEGRGRDAEEEEEEEKAIKRSFQISRFLPPKQACVFIVTDQSMKQFQVTKPLFFKTNL